METQKEVQKAGCVVVNDDNEILLVSLATEEVWTFPKGHVEDGESLENAAMREVLEETGYVVEIQKRLSDITYANQRTGLPNRVAMFLARPLKKVHEGESKTKSFWFAKNQAKVALYHNLAFILDEV